MLSFGKIPTTTAAHFSAAIRMNTKLSKKPGHTVVSIRSLQKNPGTLSYQYEAFKKTRARRRINTKPPKKTGHAVVPIRSLQKNPGTPSYQYEAFKKTRARRRTSTKPSKRSGTPSKPYGGFKKKSTAPSVIVGGLPPIDVQAHFKSIANTRQKRSLILSDSSSKSTSAPSSCCIDVTPRSTNPHGLIR